MLVSNSSTLILLAKITALKSFLEQQGTILIPEEVAKESTQNKQTSDALLIQREIGKTIEVKKIKKDIVEIQKQFRLDAGEAATYALYNAKEHHAILTDDRELIKLCKLDGIKFICALAIIVQLYKKKRITKEDCLEKIEKLQTMGRYSKEIIEYFYQEVG